MFFPYSDDNPTERFPIVTILLILANTIIALYLVFTEQFESALEQYAFYAHSPRLFAIFTSSFLHADACHLVGNMWFLWIFGDNVEDRLGRVLFLLFYLACAFAGAGVHTLVVSGEEATRGAVGASGAISGVLAAYLILYPWGKINFFYWVFYFYTGVVQIPALFVIGFWFTEQLILALVTCGEADVQIAYWAHLGGFGLGLVTIAALRLSGVVRMPKDILLEGNPGFRRALEAKEPRRALPSEPAPLKDRLREGVRVRTTTVAQDRVRKGRQLLLRALEENQPEKVVHYYSLFEQAFPTLPLPEAEQWKAAQLLDSAHHDTLALEAYRKLVDHYRLSKHWPAACLRTAQLYHLHHNYRRAREYLEALLRQAPASPEAGAARREKEQLEATLSATEVLAPEAIASTNETYLILRQTFEKMDPARVGDLVAEVTGELRLDTRARAARGQGVLAEGLELCQARNLAQRLQADGVPVLIVGEKQLLVYPEAVEVRTAELSASRAIFRTYAEEYPFDWPQLWLVSCARIHQKRKSERVHSTPITSVRPLGFERHKTTTVTQSSRVRMLDLFLSEPFLHLRIDESRFNYQYLPDGRRKESRTANFPLLVKDILRWAPGAHVGPGVDRLLSEESFTGLTFANFNELDRYNFWLVQLCNLKPAGREDIR